MRARLIGIAVVTTLWLGTAALAGGASKVQARRIDISVTKDGFEPKGITVQKGEEVTLVFTRKVERTCAKSVVVRLDGDTKVEKALPLDTPVEITATFPKAGELGYACSMDMLGGVITVR